MIILDKIQSNYIYQEKKVIEKNSWNNKIKNNFLLYQKKLIKIKLQQKNMKKKIFIKQYKSLGSGISSHVFRNKLIINWNQHHWYILSLNKNSGGLILKKRNNFLYSNQLIRLKNILYILNKIKKLNCYKEKGIIEKPKTRYKKLILKKNEQKTFL